MKPKSVGANFLARFEMRRPVTWVGRRATVQQLSHCLHSIFGERTELLLELKEISYSINGASDKFPLFIEARQKDGRTLTVIRT